MKCPRCGHWNKPSFPRCFQCGEPLNAGAQKEPSWKDKFESPRAGKVRVVYDEDEEPVAPPKAPGDEPLGSEVNRLKDRRARGEEYLKEFMKETAKRGITPTGSRVSGSRARKPYADSLDNPDETLYSPPEMRERIRKQPKPDTIPTGRMDTFDEVFPDDDAWEALPEQTADIPPEYDEPLPLPPSRFRKRRRRRRMSLPLRIAVGLVALLLLSTLAFGGWQLVAFLRDSINRRAVPAEARADVVIEETEVSGHPGHIVRIKGEEGTRVYIQELKKSFVVVGGEAAVIAADHVFYDHLDNLEAEQMTVTLTPTMISSGAETRLTPISYVIDIPLSPVELISPESNYLTVSTSIYGMRLRVEANSEVIINGIDVSDTVDDHGIVTHNPPVRAIGENVVSISVRAPYCRENNLIVTLYREPTEIPLELAADTLLATDDETMTFYATTEVGASVSVETPHQDMDTKKLATTGEFSFVAKMEHVGYNTIRIRSQVPGKRDSVLEHTVYYLPPPNIYTTKAWTFKPEDYLELLNNIAFRTKNAQIYRLVGRITEILSQNPQLAIMDTGTGGAEQLVLLENESKTTWVVGMTYRVYADVSGMYGTIPRLIGRYTYDP